MVQVFNYNIILVDVGTSVMFNINKWYFINSIWNFRTEITQLHPQFINSIFVNSLYQFERVNASHKIIFVLYLIKLYFLREFLWRYHLTKLQSCFQQLFIKYCIVSNFFACPCKHMINGMKTILRNKRLMHRKIKNSVNLVNLFSKKLEFLELFMVR